MLPKIFQYKWNVSMGSSTFAARYGLKITEWKLKPHYCTGGIAAKFGPIASCLGSNRDLEGKRARNLVKGIVFRSILVTCLYDSGPPRASDFASTFFRPNPCSLRWSFLPPEDFRS